MTKVITYGTYDLLHHGHIRLLERAKGLGDYLIVGVTSDDYDMTRGKINNQQSLMERVEAVKKTGLADEVIVEEYDGQKIDDIIKYGIDIFTVGSDWEGYFDYLNDYCKVVYLPRTQGVSSSDIRSKVNHVNINIVGEDETIEKFIRESTFVNGVSVSSSFDVCDAVYIISKPEQRYNDVKRALSAGKHVLCESPLTLDHKGCKELFEIADKKKVVLLPAIKTAYATAFSRLVLLAKSGKIGDVLSVDATCTSIRSGQSSFFDWGSIALLPIFAVLGTSYNSKSIVSCIRADCDIFTKLDLVYDKAVASIKVARGAKSEGELIVTGTKGYIYVPSPWWKTDYFELRYENPTENKRYFYQLDGEGIRYEISAFVNQIRTLKSTGQIPTNFAIEISKLMEAFAKHEDMEVI